VNSSNDSVTPCRRLLGWPTTGADDLSDEIGTDSTPWNGAGSMATVAAAAPSPAIFCAMSPPKE